MALSLFQQQDQWQHAAKSQLSWTLEQMRGLRGIDMSEQQIADLYATSVFLYACANFWADAVSGAKFIVYKDGIQVPQDHALQQILNNSGDLMRRTELARIMFGRNLIRKDRNLQQRVYGLQWVNPLIYRTDVTSEGLEGFKLFNSRYHVGTADYVELRDSIFSNEIDFEDDFDGVAPAEVAFLQASSEVELGTTALAWFRNSLFMGGIFQPTADSIAANRGADYVAAVPKFIDLLKNFFQGGSNAGRTLVQSLRWEYTQLQQDFDKVALQSTYESIRQNVSIAMNLPIEFITTGQSNYAEIQGKINLWYQLRLTPVLKRYAEDFTTQLAIEWGTGYTIEPDISGLIRIDDGTKLELVTLKVQSTLLSLYEAQIDLGNKKPDMSLLGLYQVQGVPVPAHELKNLWRYHFAGASPYAMLSPTSDDISISPASALPENEAPPLLGDGIASYIPDKQFKELRHWLQVIARKGDSYAFKSEHLPSDAVDFIQWGLSIDAPIEDVFVSAECFLRNEDDERWLTDAYAAVKRALQVGATKSIGETRAKWQTAITPVFDELAKGAVGQARAMIIMHREIERFGRMAYLDGLVDGGISDAQMTLKDFKALSSLFTRQKQFASRFIQAVLKDGLSPAQLQSKPDVWFNGSILPFFYEGQANGKDNPNERWDMDASKENCKSCVRLNGQVHRRSTWNDRGLYPNSERLLCGAGKQCGCRRTITTEAARGRFLIANLLAS